MCKKILSFLLVGICLIATLTPIRALENSEDIGLTCESTRLWRGSTG